MGSPPAIGMNSIQPCHMLAAIAEPQTRPSYRRPSGAAIDRGNCSRVSATTSLLGSKRCAARISPGARLLTLLALWLRAFGESRGHELVRRLDQRFELLPIERFAQFLFLHPHVARHVGSGNDAGPFDELAKAFRRALEGEGMRPLEVYDREHLAADAEA